MDKALVIPYLKPMVPLPTAQKSDGGLQPPIRCLLCDIYGTLFISASGDISSAEMKAKRSIQLDQLLDRYGYSEPSHSVFEKLFAAIRQRHAESKASGIDYPEVVIEAVWQTILTTSDNEQLRRFAVEFEMIVNPVWPMPGVEALLECCRAKGILLGIISNAQFFTPLLFEWLLDATPEQLGFHSELILYSYQHGYAKPSPVMFEKALHSVEALGIDRRHVAYIGNDMYNDVLPAHRVGFQTVLFAGDSRSLRLRSGDAQCRQTSPDLVVNALTQLIPHLSAV